VGNAWKRYTIIILSADNHGNALVANVIII